MKVGVVCDCMSIDGDNMVRHEDRVETAYIDVGRIVMMWPCTRRVVIDCGGGTDDLKLDDESFERVLDAFEARF